MSPLPPFGALVGVFVRTTTARKSFQVFRLDDHKRVVLKEKKNMSTNRRDTDEASSSSYHHHRQQQHDSDDLSSADAPVSAWRVAGDMLQDGAPFMLGGAALGLALYAVKRVVRGEEMLKEAERTNSESHIPAFLSSYSFLKQDASLVTPLQQLDKFAVISANWMPCFLPHVEAISKAWYVMRRYLKDAQKASARIYDEKAVDTAMHVVKDAVRKEMLNAAGVNPNDNNNTQQSPLNPHNNRAQHAAHTERVRDQVEQSLGKLPLGQMASRLLAEEAMADILKARTLANHLLKSVIHARINISGLSSLLHNLVRIYEMYWEQVGQVFLLDPSRMEERNARTCVTNKATVIEFLMEDGKLPLNPNPKKYKENDFTASHVMWWTRRHTMCLPTMNALANALGWYSVYNTQYERVAPPGLLPASTEANAETLANLNAIDERFQESARVEALARGRSAPRAGGVYQPGHSWHAPNSHVPSTSGGAREHENQTADPPVDESAHLVNITRPNVHASLKEKIEFWIKRVSNEGIAAVWDAPTAGFTPSVNEPCFLPTVHIHADQAEKVLKDFMGVLNHKIEALFNYDVILQTLANKAYEQVLHFGGGGVSSSTNHNDASSLKGSLNANTLAPMKTYQTAQNEHVRHAWHNMHQSK